MLIVVAFLVVIFFGFLVITRDHGSFEGFHWVDFFPTGLPELFKPTRDLLELRRSEFLGPCVLNIKRKQINDYYLFSV